MSNLIYTNEELTKNLKLAINQGYKFVIKAQDKFLSNWGLSENKKHLQLILCKTEEEKNIILKDLYQDNNFKYVNWYYINDLQGIYNTTRGKTWTLRNNWTRAFK